MKTLRRPQPVNTSTWICETACAYERVHGAVPAHTSLLGPEISELRCKSEPQRCTTIFSNSAKTQKAKYEGPKITDRWIACGLNSASNSALFFFFSAECNRLNMMVPGGTAELGLACMTA
jgi:hypothetical protein